MNKTLHIAIDITYHESGRMASTLFFSLEALARELRQMIRQSDSLTLDLDSPTRLEVVNSSSQWTLTATITPEPDKTGREPILRDT